MNVLSLRHAVHSSRLFDGKRVRLRQTHYLDFDIDNRPLRDLVEDPGDVITTLNRTWLFTLDQGVAELTGLSQDPDLPPGRIALLRCAECGDIQCGALTAHLDLRADTVTWSDLAWETGFPDDQPLPASPGHTFVFERSAYTTTFEEAPAKVAALPDEPLARHDRAPRWPWQRGRRTSGR